MDFTGTVTEGRNLIPRIECYVVIRSFYETDSMIRYRAGLTRNVVIPSLQNQTDPDFTLCWTFPVGCLYTPSRIELLQKSELRYTLHDPPDDRIRVVIDANDDDFLMPHVIAKAKMAAINAFCDRKGNREIRFSNGYIYGEGRCGILRNQIDMLTGRVFVNPDHPIFGEDIEIDELSWIHIRHQANTRHSAEPRGPHVRINVNGWDPLLTQKYCDATIVQASANGSNLEARRSGSLVIKKRRERR